MSIPSQNPTPLGRYTMEIHDHYIAYKVGKYLIDHPGVSQHQAAKYARAAWARKVRRVAEIMERSHDASPIH